MRERLSSSKLAQIALLGCIPLVWIGLVISLAMHTYFNLTDRAQDAASQIQSIQQDLKNLNLQSKTPLEPFKQHLAAIRADLNFLQSELKSNQPLLEFVQNHTSYRADVITAENLVYSGQDFLQAGDYAMDVAQTLLDIFNNLGKASLPGLDDSSAAKPAQGLLEPAQMERIRQDIIYVNQFVKKGTANFNQLPYDQLKPDASLKHTVEQLRNQLPLISSSLEEANTGVAVLNRLLGFDEPATYLVLLNDADELRPNGGFAGNYILITVWQGQVVSFKLENSYQPDDATLANRPITVPAEYGWWPLHFAWGLRDVSLTPDWPDTSSLIQNLLYQEGVAGNITGAIALNPGLIQNLLQTTGPVHVYSPPEYDEIVNASNFLDRIHYHQALDERDKNLDFYQRKKFMRYLAQAMLSQIKNLPKDKLPLIGKDFGTALSQRDLLLYLTDPAAQSFVDKLGWNGRLETVQDCLCVVDTSESGNKTNGVVSQTISDKINLNFDGSATHHTILTYNYDKQLADYQTSQFLLDHVAYNRFYIPSGSRIITRGGFDDSDGAASQYNRVVWGQLVALHPGQKRDFEFSWQTPALSGMQQIDSAGTYNLSVERQPGANFNYYIEVVPPEGMQIKTVTGVVNPVYNPDGSTVLFQGLLNKNLEIKLNLRSTSPQR